MPLQNLISLPVCGRTLICGNEACPYKILEFGNGYRGEGVLEPYVGDGWPSTWEFVSV